MTTQKQLEALAKQQRLPVAFDVIDRQLDLFDGASFSAVGNVTDRPVKRLKKAQAKKTQPSARKIALAKSVAEAVSPLKLRAVNEAMLVLRNLGCSYMVLDPQGVMHPHGDLSALMPQQKVKAKPMSTRAPRGSVLCYYKPLIDNLQPGDLVTVPYTSSTGVKYPPKTLHSSISSYTNRTWGAGSITASFNHKAKQLEVLRLK